jgi:hypothetical protein
VRIEAVLAFHPEHHPSLALAQELDILVELEGRMDHRDALMVCPSCLHKSLHSSRSISGKKSNYNNTTSHSTHIELYK